MDADAGFWIIAFLVVFLLIAARAQRRREPVPWIHILFFCSGFPALIYQIVWQRALFAIYGLNIQSVTIVVSAFMLGLGFNLSKATANTKALNWASNLASLLLFLLAKKVWFIAGLVMGAGQWLGARAGSHTRRSAITGRPGCPPATDLPALDIHAASDTMTQLVRYRTN